MFSYITICLFFSLATTEEEMLKNALAMSVEPSLDDGAFSPDNFEAMSEEQQIALALQMSMANDAEAMEAETMFTPAAPTTTSAALPAGVRVVFTWH